MRQIIGAPIGNIADTDQLAFKTGMHQDGGRRAVLDPKTGKTSRYFRAALATTSVLALALALATMTPRPAVAQTWTKSWAGSPTSTDWMTGTNWSPAGVPATTDSVQIRSVLGNPVVLGATTAETIVINNFGMASDGPGSGQGQLTIQNASSLTTNGTTVIGQNDNSTTKLFIQGGSKLVTNGYGRIGGKVGGGTVTISGVSTWQVGGGLTLANTASERAILNISGGSDLSTNALTRGAGSVAQVNFDGASFTGTATSNSISNFRAGELNIMAGGLTIANQGGRTVTVHSQLSGVGVLTHIGNGALSLLAANTFTGLTVSGGMVTASTATSFGLATGVLTVNTGSSIANLNNFSMAFAALAGTGGEVRLGSGSLTLNQNSDTTYAGAITGTGGLTKNGTGTLTLTGASTFTGALDVNRGTVVVDGGSLDLGSSHVYLTPGTGNTADFTMQNGAKVTTAGLFRVVAGGGGTSVATVTGAGTKLTLNNTISLIVGHDGDGTLNIFDNGEVTTTGYTILGQGTGSGTLKITGGGKLTTTTIGYIGGQTGTATGDATVSGANSKWGVGGDLLVGNVGKGELTIGGIGAANAGGAVTVGGNMAVGATAGVEGTVTIQNGGTLTNTGYVLVGPGNGDVTVKNQGSNWTINGNGLTVGYSAGTSTLTISDKATVDVKAGDTGIGRISGNGTLLVESGGVLNSTGNAWLGGSQPNEAGTGDATVSGQDSAWNITGWLDIGRGGTGSLTIDTGGMVTIGATYLASGTNTDSTLIVNSAGVLETLSVVGRVGTKSVTFNNGTLKALGASTIFISGFAAGEFVLDGTGASSGMTVDSNGFDVTAASQLSGSGALTKVGAGTLTLGVANVFTGGLNVNAGTVTAGIAGAFSSGLLTVLDGATANLNGFDQTVSGLVDNGGAGAASVTLGTGTLTVNPGTGESLSFAGVISGAGGFTKDGAGTQTLSGSNSYGGLTTVSAGTLYVDGTQTGTGAASVKSGATLGGGGKLGGDVAVESSGTLVATNVPAAGRSLDVGGNLTLAAGSSLTYDFGTTPNVDPDGLSIDVTGNVNLAGTLTVNGSGFDPGQVYELMTYNTTGTNTVALVEGTIPAGLYLQTAVAGAINLVNTTGLGANFWDGAGAPDDRIISGGSGVWQANGSGANSNWAEINGDINGPWINVGPAIFQATGGTVQVDNSKGAVSAGGLTFMADGYILDPLTAGDTLTLAPTGGATDVVIDVGEKGNAVHTATINVELTGATGITKTDAGTLVLNNAGNSYTGGTRIEDGTIEIAADGALGQSPATQRLTLAGSAGNVATLANTATIDTSRAVTLDGMGGTFQTDAAMTLNGIVDGGGALTKTGTSTLTLNNGSNAFTGGLNVDEGAVIAGAAGAFGSGPLAVATNATADLAGHDQSVGGLSGAGAVTLGAGDLTVTQTGASTYSGKMTGTTGTLTFAGGSLTLSNGSNAFSGLNVNTGTVTAGAAGAFGGGALAVASGAIADLADFAQTVTGLSGAGAVKLGTATPGAGTLTVNQAVSTTSSFAGIISGTGALVKEGAGDLTLSGANSFTGGLTVTAGKLIAGIDDAFGAGLLTVNGGTADLNGKNVTVKGLAGASAGTVSLGTTSPSILTLDQTATTSYAGKITGTGSLVKGNTGELTLSGNNDFSGGLKVNGGKVIAGSDTAFGTGLLTVNALIADINGHAIKVAGLAGNGGTVALGAGTLTLDQTTPAAPDYAGKITGTAASSLVMDGTGTQTLSGDNGGFLGGLAVKQGTLKAGSLTAFGKGVLTVDGGTADLNGHSITVAGLAGAPTPGGIVALGAATLTIDAGMGTTYSGQITGAGGLVKDGAGTQILAGANSYTGGTTVKDGTLQAGSATAFGAVTGMLTVDGGIADLGGNNMTFAALRNTTGTAGGEVKLGAGTLRLNQTVDTAFAGQITGATGGLTKTNAGKLTLSGASSYGGPTKVDGGTLQVNGSITSPTTVSGATSVLAGRGSITGDVTVESGGTLHAYDDNADGQNRLAITGKLTVDAASFLQYDYGRNPNLDQDVLMVDVTGDVELNGTVNVTNTSSDNFGPGAYGIVHYSGSRTGTLQAGGTLAPFGLTLQQGVVPNNIYLVNLGVGERNWWDPHGAPNSIAGGAGEWTMAQTGAESANWAMTDGNSNGHYEASFFAIFSATPGIVTVTGGVTTPGMQFLVDGYTIQGDPITLANPTGVENTVAGQTSIIVGDRSGASNSHVVTIASVLAGTDMLVKEDVGTLVLSGANTYSGGTLIDDGTLQISRDENLGADASGGLTTAITFEGTAALAATLANTGAAIDSARPVTLNGAGGTFQTDANLTLTGTIGGGGALTKTGAATLTLSGANSYGGGTFLNAGVVSVKANANLGADAGGLTFNGGTLENTAAFTTSARSVTVNASGATFKTDADLTLAGSISGPAGTPGNLTKSGAGNLILTADNSTYAGTFNVASGALHVGNGGSSGTLGGDTGSVALAGGTTLVFDRADAYQYDGLVTGAGALTQAGGPASVTTLTGKNSYKGATTVSSGRLNVNGDQSAATGPTMVNAGTLSGKGTIGGDVTVAAGADLTAEDVAGDSGFNALTIKGSLALDPGSSLNYLYGQSPNGDHDALMIEVGGDLDLNGTLNVANNSGQDFEAGIYGLIRYGGALSGSGLTLGAMPDDQFMVQTSVAGRVNLAYTAGEALSFWNAGGVPTGNGPAGGTGVWQAAAGNTNWTNHAGTVTAGYADDSVPVFMGAPGTVTVDDSLGAIRVAGMQFAVSGYTIKGDAITLTSGRTGIRVGEHTDDSAAYIATIASELTGAGQLAKTDFGTLVLTGANSYTGGTLVDAGTLRIAKDANLGAASGGLALDGGTLANTAAFSTARNVTLDANGGTFQTGEDLTLTGLVSGAGALTKTGAADLILSATTTYGGATFVKSGTLAAGRANVFSPASAFNVGASGTLDLRGYDQSVGALTNAGKVSLGGATPGATLTVNGDYAAKDGGIVALTTKLEGDNAKTDRLHVKGATSGATTLAVTNAGGGGAQTDNGIRLVEVDGASNGQFTLAGDYTFQGDQALVAGAYAYRLYQNGLTTPDDGDWYLRSSLLEGDNPQFQAGVPLYEAYAGVLQSFNQLDTLQHRLGNRSWTIEAQGADGLSEEVAPEYGAKGQSLGVWGSIQAADHRYRPERSTSASDYDAAVWKIEAGVDSQLYETATGRLIGGVSLHYGTIAADIASPHGDGKIDATGYGLAGTLTWYGNDGLYLDGQARATWYDSDLSSATAGQSLVSGNDGTGYGLSIEAGKRIPIAPSWSVTPQAQLAWSRVDFDGFSDGFDATVTLNDGDSLLGRMGLTLDHEREWQDRLGKTRRMHVYGLANLYYDFDNGSTVDVASTRFVTENEALWGGVGLGGSYNWDDNRYSVYGEALARTSIDSFGDSHILSGNVGMRIRW
ncbi:autotransporter outer membrane beta-barrel domain-containing protein [Phyllobacterium phragmitis]|nr:autotransporter outer membrane beta-barrel domain-containing protein [Phyllobacterium phragmitis]